MGFEMKLVASIAIIAFTACLCLAYSSPVIAKTVSSMLGAVREEAIENAVYAAGSIGASAVLCLLAAVAG